MVSTRLDPRYLSLLLRARKLKVNCVSSVQTVNQPAILLLFRISVGGALSIISVYDNGLSVRPTLSLNHTKRDANRLLSPFRLICFDSRSVCIAPLEAQMLFGRFAQTVMP